MIRLAGWLERAIDAGHVLALAAWLSAIAAAGAAAVGVFSTLPRSGVVVPAFTPYVDAVAEPADRAREHGRIAGGIVMAPIFAGGERVQIVAGSAALVTLVVQLVAFRRRWPLRRPANGLRALCVVGAAALVTWHVLVTAPPMDAALTGWWSAAQQSDVVGASRFRAEFDALHGAADPRFRARLVLVAAALALVAMAAVPRRPGETRLDEAGLDRTRQGAPSR